MSSKIKTQVLITREIGDSSPLLSVEGCHIHGVSFIDFQPIPFDIPRHFPVEWVFFYSKKCVDMALKNDGFAHWIKEKRLSCFGNETGKYLAHLGFYPEFVGDADENSISEFSNMSLSSSVLILQGTSSKRRLQNSHHFHKNYIEIECYHSIKNVVNLQFIPDVLITTSPLNADFFLEQYHPPATIISIGKTTYHHLKDKYHLDSFISPYPSENGMAIVLKSVLLNPS